jgi:hypothetical protein
MAAQTGFSQVVHNPYVDRSKLLGGGGCDAAAFAAASMAALLSASGAIQTLTSCERSSAKLIRTWYVLIRSSLPGRKTSSGWTLNPWA